MSQRKGSRHQRPRDMYFKSMNHAIRLIESDQPGEILRDISIERRKLALLRAQLGAMNRRRSRDRRKPTTTQIEALSHSLHGYLTVDYNFTHGDYLWTPRPRNQFTI